MGLWGYGLRGVMGFGVRLISLNFDLRLGLEAIQW